ncbi:hypothetical protein GTY86_35725 [Streptomyces sp. SID5770]|uniref:hypothetical protein n=1 Tax=Streptomyces sp. SID5770 TaxID=2690308 RepID=UPI00136C2A25|nr:hypothetical protein [Streptomyces sp. SID5770]MZE53785.1 hypothetical protein [Streptomyces sp. SID5770]MZE56526.1 hypothetical protein [Streptomyces sp. SID5770]
MGYKLRRDLRVALGPKISGLMRIVALEIADDANDNTRESMVPLDVLACWCGAEEASVREALKRLGKAGWELRVPIGRGKDGRVLYAVPGMRMTYRVPEFEVPKGESQTLEGRVTSPSEARDTRPSDTEGRVTSPSEGVRNPSEGSDTRPFPSLPSPPHVDKDSLGAEVDLEAFGAFWLVYPKKKAREEAKKAWIAAIKRGATPEHIVSAAQAYARERAQQDPKYTKYPATWLNKGCYDDEPEQPALPDRPQLRAVAGGWQPYQNPTDPSVYENGF